MTHSAYWTKTASQSARGGGIGVGVGLVAGMVFALLKMPEIGFSRSGTMPPEVTISLFVIGIAIEGAIVGGVAGLVAGYLWPVSQGPPFPAVQLPPKFILLCVVLGTAYLGFIRPKLAEQRKEQDYRRALGSRDVAEVRKAIRSGAVDIPVGDGTPLIEAAQRGNVEICSELLSQGADANRKNLQGETALMVALKNSHAEVAQALVDAGADVNMPDAHGLTPLMMAAELNRTSIVEALLAKGAEVNHVVLYGSYSPLIAAVMYQRVQNVELLLQAGADTNLAPQGGDTPLVQARRTGNQAIVDLLTAQGAR